MGANVAPTFANIFVATLESDAIYISHHFQKVVKWWRYIDDIFVIWRGTVEELQEFHDFLNGINNTVKFTLTLFGQHHFFGHKGQICSEFVSYRIIPKGDGQEHSPTLFKWSPQEHG